jgi:hypothetical protein
LYDDQKKRLTKFALRKGLIRKEMFLAEQNRERRKNELEKEKREQAPALQTWLSTR